MLRIASSAAVKRLSAVAGTTVAGTILYTKAQSQHRPNTVSFCSSLSQEQQSSLQLKNVNITTKITKKLSSDNNKDNNNEIHDVKSGEKNEVCVESPTNVNNADDAGISNQSNHTLLFDQEQNLIEQIRPITQASIRALRLAKTVTMIIFDYKLDSYKHSLNEVLESTGYYDIAVFANFGGNEFKRQNLERDVQKKLDELQEAQRRYAEPDNDDNDDNKDEDSVKEEKIKARRSAVHEAAEKLGEAEQKLSDWMNNEEGANNKTSALPNSSSDNDENDNGEIKPMSVHAKAANRLRDLCRLNGGTYIKVGQHIANLDHLLPPDYITILQSLFGDCPVTPYEDVREVIHEELGDYPEDVFDEFCKVPIASASIAQVHVAIEKGTGRKLAVKVQHRGLRETSRGDLLALETVVRLVDGLFDKFKWGWIVDEIAPNLPKELDFKHEGQNAEKAAEHIRKSGLDCIVPKVHWDRTTPRLLCMDFEEGYSVTNTDEMDKQKLNKRDLSSLISSVFQAQIFEEGFIHCDPHPANVLWRKTKNGKPQLILLDHGLYKQIDDDFRINYANLWKGLLIADIDTIKKSCSNMGISEMYPLLSAMLMSRPFDEVLERSKTKSFSAKKKIDDKSDAAMIRGYAQQYIGEIIKLLDKVPRQMLLLFKMNDCLRHIDHALGSNSTKNLVIAGKYAVRASYKDGHKATHQDSQRIFMNDFKQWLSFIVVMSRIRFYEVVEWWINSRQLAIGT